jgi:hypothetical protein
MTWLETKAWWRSRTVWLGIVTAFIGGIEVLAQGSLLSDEAKAWALVVVGALGIVLRKLTETKI